MDDLVNISLGNAGIIALLGYLVVFFGLVLLMAVIMIMGRIMVAKAKKAQGRGGFGRPGSRGPEVPPRLCRRAEAL